MSKKTILFLVMSAISLMSAAEARQISVDRITSLSTVLGANFESNPKKVGDVNALPIDVLDIDVNRKQIDLAWNLHSKAEGDPDKLASAKKAIETYADEVMQDAADELEREETAQKEADVLAEEQREKAAQEELEKKNKSQSKDKSSAKTGSKQKPKTSNKGAGDGDDETYAVTTPLKWRGELCKEVVECTSDEADELREQGLIA